jgi:predicted ATPase
MRGCALAMRGQVQEGISQLRQGLGALQATGKVQTQPYFLALLAESYSKTSQIEAGLTAVSVALELVDKISEGQYELVPVYKWFTEGFDTADLQEARALLGELTE